MNISYLMMYDQALWLNSVGKKWSRKITWVILCRNLRDCAYASYDMEKIRGTDLQRDFLEIKSLGLVENKLDLELPSWNKTLVNFTGK